MTDVDSKHLSDIIPAASVILMQDTPKGIELFMVARNYEVDSFSGALVFPGGKVHPGDHNVVLRDYCCIDQGLDDQDLALRVSAIREAFEESGVLLARYRATGDFIDEDDMNRLEPYRGQLERGDIDLLALVQQEDIELATDQLVHFSNLVTPEGWARKRFDTHFYVVSMPRQYQLIHDGCETISSVWDTPDGLLEDADNGRWNIVFPTRVNLSKIALFSQAEQVVDACRDRAVEKITPEFMQDGDHAILNISENAGFPFHHQRLYRPE